MIKQQMTLRSLLVITSLLLGLSLHAEALTIHVETPGTLSSYIPDNDIDLVISSLTLTGDLNGTDIRYIRRLAGSDFNGNATSGTLSVLDISGANIVAGGDYSSSDNAIGNTMFYNCIQLTSIALPNSVTSIGNYAFWGCYGLTSIIIPNSVTSIGDRAFYGCYGLTSITIGNSVASIGNNAFYGCSRLTSITFPNSVTSIGEHAFDECRGLTSVSIGNSVTSIYDGAFKDFSGLTSVTIGNSVTSIGNEAFSGCTGLTSISIPSSVTSIGIGAFQRCSKLTSITIPNSVTSIGYQVFLGCTGLTSVTIPNSVTSIGDQAFGGCTGLTSVTIGNSVTSIGDQAFSGCIGLTDIFVSEENISFCSVDGVLFSKDKSTLLSCPNSKSDSYSISNCVTSIGNYAFFNCSGLTSVTIGKSVTSIGESAFSGCSRLKEIHCESTNPPIAGSHSFDAIDKISCKLYIPKGSYTNYWFAAGWGDFWGDFTNIIEEEITSNTQILSGNIKVYTEVEAIVIEGAESRETISVYTESGALIQTTQATDDIVRFNVPKGHVYLVKTVEKTFKIAL